MPIPRYFSKGELPQSALPKIPESFVGQEAEAISNAGRTIANIGDKLNEQFKQANDAREYSQAVLASTKGLFDLEETISTSPEFQSDPLAAARSLSEQSEKLRAQYRQGIRDQVNQAQFDQRFQEMSLNRQLSLNDAARRKVIDLDVGSLTSELAEYEHIYAASGTDSDRMMIESGAADAIGKRIQTGSISSAQGTALSIKTLEGMRTNRIRAMLPTDPEGALDLIESLKIDESARVSLRADAMQKIEANRMKSAGRLKSSIKDDLASMRTTGKGIPGLADQVASVYGRDAADEYLRDRQRAEQYYLAVKQGSFADPEGMADILEWAKPQEGSEDYAEKYKLYTEVVSFAQNRQRAIDDDPAAYARQSPDVETLDDLLSLQEHMGVPAERRRVLTKTEASSYVAKFNAMPAEQRPAALQRLSESSGKHFNHIFRELVEAKLSPENHVLLSLIDNPSAPIVQPVLAEAISIGSQELKKGIPATDVATLNAGVYNAMADFRAAMMAGDTTGERSKFVNELQEVVTSVALVYMRKGKAADEAAELATNQIINDRYHPIEANTYVIPKKFDRDRIRRNLDTMQKSIETASFDFLIPGRRGTPDIPPGETERQDYFSAIKRNGFWATNPDESGVILYDHVGNPVHDASDRFFELKFRDVEKTMPEDAPSVPIWDGISGISIESLAPYFGGKSKMRRAIPPNVSAIVGDVSEKYGVPKDLLEKVLNTESRFQAGAVSPKGAVGIMQLMPKTAKDMGVEDSLDVRQNIEGGTKYLAMLLKRYDGDQRKALAAYNWGMGNVDKWDGKDKSLPKETRDYLKKILG